MLQWFVAVALFLLHSSEGPRAVLLRIGICVRTGSNELNSLWAMFEIALFSHSMEEPSTAVLNRFY